VAFERFAVAGKMGRSRQLTEGKTKRKQQKGTCIYNPEIEKERKRIRQNINKETNKKEFNLVICRVSERFEPIS
jgi:hypothetical protein